MKKDCFECDMHWKTTFICEGCKKGMDREFLKYLRKVMRRKANLCKDWLSFDLEKDTIRFYSKIRGNEWNQAISEFKRLNK